MKQLGIVVLFAPALAGCDMNVFWERFHSGTTKGFHLCREAGTKQKLSERAIRQYCTERHHKVVRPGPLDGRAGYNESFSGVTFSGSVTNKTNDIIYTEFTVSVRHTEAPVGMVERKTFSGQWIEPGANTPFSIDANELTFKPDQKKEKDAKPNEKRFTWDIDSAKGIEISF